MKKNKVIEDLNGLIVFNDSENESHGYCITRIEKERMVKLIPKYGISIVRYPEDETVKAHPLKLIGKRDYNTDVYKPNLDVTIDFPIYRINWAGVSLN